MSEQVELFKERETIQSGQEQFDPEALVADPREPAKSVYKRAKRVCVALGLDIEDVIADALCEWMERMTALARR